MKCIYCENVVHLAKLASNPQTRQYARERTEELEAEKFGLFRGLYLDVKKRMATGLDAPMVCDRPVLMRSPLAGLKSNSPSARDC